MSAFECPHCQSWSTFNVTWASNDFSTYVGWPTGDSQLNDASARCSNPRCQLAVGGVVSAHDRKNLIEWWPKKVAGKHFPDVPERIASAADEAHRCLSIGALSAAILVARAVVEATAKDNGVKEGKLDHKIKTMAQKGLIEQPISDTAHTIRFWGNDAAHGDLALENYEPEDAQEVVVLMDVILERIYQVPARTQRIRESREARRKGGSGGVPDAQQQA